MFVKRLYPNLNKNGLKIRLSGFAEPKRTSTTHRCISKFHIDNLNEDLKIKIEVSRRNIPDPSRVKKLNNIKVYSPDDIAQMKLYAADEKNNPSPRIAARDLHDIIFLASKKEKHLNNKTLESIEEFLSDLPGLAVLYESAYESDEILVGRLFSDLEIAERWIESRRDRSGLIPGIGY